jgi:ATP-dependent Clp protease ATP-binding subunit ClpB
MELEQAQRQGDLAKAGSWPMAVPELEKQLAEAQPARNALLREEVTAEDIAAVVSRWTGVPVDHDGRRARKAAPWKRSWASGVIGQKDAVVAVSKAVRRPRAGLQDPNRPLGSSCSLAPRAWARPS